MKVAKSRDLYDLFLLTVNELSSKILSVDGGKRLAKFIGDIAWTVQRRQRQAIADHISVVLRDEVVPDPAKQLTRKVFQNRWVERFSYSVLKRKTPCQNIPIDGIEHLDEALRRGRGVILWETSFGKRLVGKAALMEKGFVLCQVHDREHGGSRSWFGQKVIRSIYRKVEARYFPDVIEIQDDSIAYLRLLVDRLRKNGIVCLSGLGAKGHKFTSLDFLGSRKRFATGAVSLAKMTGAALIPIFCVTRDEGSDRVIIEKAIKVADREDSMDGVKEYAGLLESYIRKYPDQWYQWHRTQ